MSADPAASSSPLLEVRGVSKTFPGVRALSDVALTLHAGEVLGVIGENGAGKSTLMKILGGIQTPDKGQLFLDGREVTIRSSAVAIRLGIALIHQELDLADNLTVGANIFLGREPHVGGWIRQSVIDQRAEKVLAEVGAGFAPRTLVSNLSTGQQQQVEIAKALSMDARVLIMDEPTSSLSQRETELLFEVVRDLKSRGIGIIYISHRLGEVTALCDRVLGLRDGRNAGILEREEIGHDSMVRLMVGRDVGSARRESGQGSEELALEVDRLRTRAHPQHEVSFRVHKGEIVGIAGLVGSGRTELLRALFGIDANRGGEIRVGEARLEEHGPSQAIRRGLVLVPEDRKQEGLFLGTSIEENISIATLFRRNRLGFTDAGKEQALSEDTIDRMRVKTPSREQLVGLLSGGNQQKVVLGKWLAAQPKVLLLDEPTRGIDIGARQEIYSLMEELTHQGVTILFVSSELEEILTLSDRVLVMHEGKLQGELLRSELSEESVMRLATGTGDAP